MGKIRDETPGKCGYERCKLAIVSKGETYHKGIWWYWLGGSTDELLRDRRSQELRNVKSKTDMSSIRKWKSWESISSSNKWHSMHNLIGHLRSCCWRAEDGAGELEFDAAIRSAIKERPSRRDTTQLQRDLFRNQSLRVKSNDSFLLECDNFEWF